MLPGLPGLPPPNGLPGLPLPTACPSPEVQSATMSLKKERAAEVVHALRRLYPKAKVALSHRNPFQLLIATILSAQTTDAKVNEVTKVLFRSYGTASALASARPNEIESIVKSTGYYRNKTKLVQAASRALVERHEGRVPDSMEELTALPGVGRKTANLVLSNAYGKAEGVVVDTHVARLSERLGFTKHSDATKVEAELMKLLPREDWTFFAHAVILHGRQVCAARKPNCSECMLNEYCPSARAPLE
jgi:endonuclease-3